MVSLENEAKRTASVISVININLYREAIQNIAIETLEGILEFEDDDIELKKLSQNLEKFVESRIEASGRFTNKNILKLYDRFNMYIFLS